VSCIKPGKLKDNISSDGLKLLHERTSYVLLSFYRVDNPTRVH